MASEVAADPGPPWYARFFSYLKNHNRVFPGKVELSECDFFIVARRRTLRVLKPSLKSGWYYETTGDLPESVDDNFFARWSKRPHPSGNCRCSFRQSNRFSTTEEQIITAEINRIRTSLCEAERTGQDIETLEQTISVNLENLIPVTAERNATEKKVLEVEPVAAVDRATAEDEAIKDKIVKDLERYINRLLEEILSDSMKFAAASEGSVRGKRGPAADSDANFRRLDVPTSEDAERPGDATLSEFPDDETSAADDDRVFDRISFAFHAGSDSATEKEEGYVNRAFLGSSSDPDSLGFCLRGPVGTGAANCRTLEQQLDCVDSGINSVETVEFQPEQEPSLEQSLMEIIDAKLGRVPAEKSWDVPSAEPCEKKLDDGIEEIGEELAKVDATPERSETRRLSAAATRETVAESENDFSLENAPLQTLRVDATSEKTIDVLDATRASFRSDLPGSRDSRELEEATNGPSFEKLRLEFEREKSTHEENVRRARHGGVSILREKLISGFGDSRGKSRRGKEEKGATKLRAVELDDYRKRWSELEEFCPPLHEQASSRNFVMMRKNRKPTIVFLHGFGSSAEIFTHQLEYFSRLGYPCIAPDLLGHGMSSAPDRSRDYHFEKLLKDLDAILHHYAFKPGQKCVLVAHNYGCSFATALACKYDSSIHQLVLISGGGPTPLAPPSTENAGHCCLRAVFTPLLMCGLRREIMYSARGRQHPYCGTEPKEQWPSHMKYVQQGMVWPEGDYVFYRRICTPTLLVHGLRDNKVSLVQECQMERTMVKAFLEAIPTAGHCPMTDCPDQLNHMIQCFIDLWKNKEW